MMATQSTLSFVPNPNTDECLELSNVLVSSARQPEFVNQFCSVSTVNVQRGAKLESDEAIYANTKVSKLFNFFMSFYLEVQTSTQTYALRFRRNVFTHLA